MKIVLLIVMIINSALVAQTWYKWNKPPTPTTLKYIDNKNQIWNSTDSSFEMYSEGTAKSYNFRKTAPKSLGKYARPTYFNDSLFVVTIKESPLAIITFNPKKETFRYSYYPDTMPSIDMLGPVHIAKDGSFWADAGLQGMIHFHHDIWTLYDSTNSTLNRSWGGTPYFDNNGKVWIPWGSTYGNPCGISIFDGNNWSIIDSATYQIPVSFSVNDIVFHPDNSVWMALGAIFPFQNANGGIVCLRNGNATYYDPQKAWGNWYTNIPAIEVEQNGRLWFNGNGTTLDGKDWVGYLTDSLHFIHGNNTTYEFSLDSTTNACWWIMSKGASYCKRNDSLIPFDTLVSANK